MDWTKLNQLKEHYKELAPQFDLLNQLLSKLLKRDEGKLLTVTPYVVARTLDIPEIDALMLLSIAADKNIFQIKYKVWSEDNTLLGDYDNKKDIPEKIEHPTSGDMLDRDHFFVDVAFEVEKE